LLAVAVDAIVLVNTTTMLAVMGRTDFAAASGADALQILAREQVDLLLTDFAMPQMSGHDLADAAPVASDSAHKTKATSRLRACPSHSRMRIWPRQ